MITHDFMETYGGAERVTAEMAIAFPDAEVVALLGTTQVAERMGVADRFHSLVRPHDALLRHYRLFAPGWGALADRMIVPDADIVLSSSYAYAHRLTTADQAPIVCYCHSPLRFAWTMTPEYRDRMTRNVVGRAGFAALAAVSRRGDRKASRRVLSYITQSEYTAKQIRTFYERNAEVIGAPVDTRKFHPGSCDPDDYFLLCGRMIEPYKKVGVTIEAFRRLGRRLVVAGDGPALAEIRASAPPNVTFLGHLPDADLVEVMQRCQALVFPSRDDFGLVPVEVMACGRPVLAFAGGGAEFTVVKGRTGEHFPAQTPEAIVEAVERFDATAYDSAAIREHAMTWDRERFRGRLREAVMHAFAGSPQGDRRVRAAAGRHPRRRQSD